MEARKGEKNGICHGDTEDEKGRNEGKVLGGQPFGGFEGDYGGVTEGEENAERDRWKPLVLRLGDSDDASTGRACEASGLSASKDKLLGERLLTTWELFLMRLIFCDVPGVTP